MKQEFSNRWLLYGVAVILIIMALLVVSKGYFFTALLLVGIAIFIGIWDLLSDD